MKKDNSTGFPPLSSSADTGALDCLVSYALDLLELDGRNLQREPIKKRKTLLLLRRC